MYKTINMNGRLINLYKDDNLKFKHKLNKKDILKIPLSSKAMAYNGKPLYESAVKHKNSNVFIHMDIKKFFDNITKNHINFSNNFHIQLFEESLASHGGLAQGSVLAPLFSNIIMKEFDEKVNNYCEQNDIIYTRYSDDIYLSSQKEFNIIPFITEELNKMNFTVNEKKTNITNFKNQNHVKILGFNIVRGKYNNYLTIGRKKRTHNVASCYKHASKHIDIKI